MSSNDSQVLNTFLSIRQCAEHHLTYNTFRQVGTIIPIETGSV